MLVDDDARADGGREWMGGGVAQTTHHKRGRPEADRLRLAEPHELVLWTASPARPAEAVARGFSVDGNAAPQGRER